MKTANTKLRVFIQPNFVKKSYLYLGIPPLTTINSAMSITNFILMNIDSRDVTLRVVSAPNKGFIISRVIYVIDSMRSINIEARVNWSESSAFCDKSRGFIYHEKNKIIKSKLSRPRRDSFYVI